MHRPISAERLSQAYRWCEELATSHYENFPVGSILLPKAMRPHIYAVYAFSRTADDIADEPWTSEAELRVKRLDELVGNVLQWAAGDVSDDSHLGVALSHTIVACRLDSQLLLDLLSAFRQDALFIRPTTWSDVLDYCSRSANPVGRLVLSIAGVRDAAALTLSDDVCTGLQLVNFWQDLSIDLPRGRTYLPREDCERQGNHATLLDGLAIARGRLRRGSAVVRHVRGRLRWELKLIIATATRILADCERNATRLPTYRPILGRTDYLWALVALLTGRWSNGLR